MLNKIFIIIIEKLKSNITNIFDNLPNFKLEDDTEIIVVFLLLSALYIYLFHR